MAEPTDLTPVDASSCCSAAAQETCCDPREKAACCETSAAGEACGCADALREAVRERYASAARSTASEGCGGGGLISDDQAALFGAGLYGDDRGVVPEDALLASLGCGNPTAMVELSDGMTVLDLGSGGGIDVLLSARRVAPTGVAYGLDMTDEMLELARANQARSGLTNVHWLKGRIEAIPLPAGSVDVVLSNCVINLSTDKPAVLRETARVLKPGGRLAVSDVIADPGMDDATRASVAAYTGCIAGALTRAEYERYLSDAGLADIEITGTHRVHEHAGSAIIRARKPAESNATPQPLSVRAAPEAAGGPPRSPAASPARSPARRSS